MRTILCLLLIMTYCKTVGHSIANRKTEVANKSNVFIITLDGFRWQELFFGADSSLINNPDFTKDSAIVKEFFWHKDSEVRRQKLMPFFWNVISQKGQLSGNRSYNNKVNVTNIYALSYAGYNEIFTGSNDLSIFSNSKINNRNSSFFEYLDKKFFKGKVASFSSWSLFPYIFNKSKSGFYINSQAALFEDALTSSVVKDQDGNPIRNDYETYELAKDYIIKNHPRAVHIGLSGTDTYGHKKQYDHYLYQAHLADKIIQNLWSLVQASSFYRNNTTFIITTDHGRGSSENNWYEHGFFVKGSSQTWVALLGKGVKNLGECKRSAQLYEKQVAGTMGYLLNISSYNNYSLPINLFTSIK